METILGFINTFKLKQGKHCANLFYYCADNWVPQEAIFYLAAERYIFTKDPYMARVFTDILWARQGDLSLNMQWNDRGIIHSMISSPEIRVNMGVTKHRTFARRGGLEVGSAGDFNVMTRAIEFCCKHVSQTKILVGQRAIKKDGSSPNAANQNARDIARGYVNDNLGPILGDNPLKKLGVFH